MRQSIDTFRHEEASCEILALLAEFRKQWNKYTECMDKVGQRLDDAVKSYTEVVGVRTRQLDRQLDKIDDLRAPRQGSETGPLHPLTASSIIAGPPGQENADSK